MNCQEYVKAKLQTLGKIKFTGRELSDTLIQDGAPYSYQQITNSLQGLSQKGIVHRTREVRDKSIVWANFVPENGVRPAKRIAGRKSPIAKPENHCELCPYKLAFEWASLPKQMRREVSNFIEFLKHKDR